MTFQSPLSDAAIPSDRRRVGGPNDKASLTISRQEQGGERGKLNCQRGEEKRGGAEGGGVGGGWAGDWGWRGRLTPILQNGARHNLFIWCPSGSTFPLQRRCADLPPTPSHPLPLPRLSSASPPHFTSPPAVARHSLLCCVHLLYMRCDCAVSVAPHHGY